MRAKTSQVVDQAPSAARIEIARSAWNGCSRRNRLRREIRDNMKYADGETISHPGDNADTHRAVPADLGELPARRNRHCASVRTEMLRPGTLESAKLFSQLWDQ